jgi:1-acyl-sn-glycerol-3-phosphate acyltransferase
MKLEDRPHEHWSSVDPRRLQRGFQIFLRAPGRWLYQYRAYGPHPRVPEDGGFIIAPNHGSYVDPFIFGLGQHRLNLRFMTKYEAMEWPVLGRIFRTWGAFPVHRGSSRAAAALSIARHVLEHGGGLMLFPEGTISRGHDGLGIPRNGIALLALWTGVPVVPVAAWGAKKSRYYGKRRPLWRRPKVTVLWGQPFQFPQEDEPSEERIAEVRDMIWDEIVRLYGLARELQERPEGRPATYEVPGRDAESTDDRNGSSTSNPTRS